MLTLLASLLGRVPLEVEPGAGPAAAATFEARFCLHGWHQNLDLLGCGLATRWLRTC